MPVSQDLARLARRFAATDPELSSAQLKSTRFAYLASPRRLVVLVPPEDKAPDWALVYGLAERHGRMAHPRSTDGRRVRDGPASAVADRRSPARSLDP